MNDSVGDAELLGMLADGAPEAVTDSEPDPLADKHSEGLTLSVPQGVGVKDVVIEVEGVVVTVWDKDAVVQRVAVRVPDWHTEGDTVGLEDKHSVAEDDRDASVGVAKTDADVDREGEKVTVTDVVRETLGQADREPVPEAHTDGEGDFVGSIDSETNSLEDVERRVSDADTLGEPEIVTGTDVASIDLVILGDGDRVGDTLGVIVNEGQLETVGDATVVTDTLPEIDCEADADGDNTYRPLVPDTAHPAPGVVAKPRYSPDEGCETMLHTMKFVVAKYVALASVNLQNNKA